MLPFAKLPRKKILDTGLPKANGVKNLPRIEKVQSRSSVGALPKLTKKSLATGIKNPLTSRYQMSEEMVAQVSEVFGNDSYLINSFAAMSLHVKGLNFTVNEIVETVKFLGESSLDKENWVLIGDLKKKSKDTEVALLSYAAGLSPLDMVTMSEDELTVENLKIMVKIRNF